MNIYLAGKIGYYDWRHEIVHGLNDYCRRIRSDSTADCIMVDSIRIDINDHCQSFYDYSGPFFRAWGHGSTHGDNRHGTGDEASYQVFIDCLAQIDNSDLVFAWIDSFDCFGTLTEIGYAYGKGIPVVIGHPEGFNEPDIWFPCAGANRIYGDDPQTVLYNAIRLMESSEPDRSNRLLKRTFARRNTISETKIEAEFRLADFELAVSRVLQDAKDLAGRGNASWRDLIDFSIVRPLNRAVSNFQKPRQVKR